jgi:nicotinate phosphoribosyltransferase
MVLEIRTELGVNHTNEGELASFIAYAQAFPRGFLALVDTYDTLKSGVPNFICVALGLLKLGYKPIGIRLDSGDLSYLSKETRKVFNEMGARTDLNLTKCLILASNEINKSVLISLKQQGHEIDSFGIGTHLVTCDDQPAMGCVYKLVEARGIPRIKVSQELGKMTIPGEKEVYRLFGEDHEEAVGQNHGRIGVAIDAPQSLPVRRSSRPSPLKSANCRLTYPHAGGWVTSGISLNSPSP